MDVLGGVAARLLRVPWVISERSSALSYPPTLLNRFRAAVGDHADRIVSNSPGGTDYWAARGFDQSRIEIIPNFVPVTEIEAAADLDDPRLSDGDELVLCVGRLNVEKNLDAVVDAG
jgi:glycosyltransferase involved in cell wall biosynthesis